MLLSRGEVTNLVNTDQYSLCSGHTALWYIDPNTNLDHKLSYEDLSVASRKAANAIQGLGVQKAVCVLPKVSWFKRCHFDLMLTCVRCPSGGSSTWARSGVT